MGRLVNVYRLRHRIPCRNQKTGLCFADTFAAERIFENDAQFVRSIFAPVEPLNTAQFSLEKISKHAVILAENLGAVFLVKTKKL